MWPQLRQQFMLHIPFFVVVFDTAAFASSRMVRGKSNPPADTTPITVPAISTAAATDKLLLLNDLSLEQAYLHHSSMGAVPGAVGGSSSLAQQAARLAAGSYSGTTGQALGGWRVQATYQNINSVAVISTRPGADSEKQTCALAFRGSDDRLDWRNDYMARPFPMLLCGEEEEDKERFFLDILTTRADNAEDGSQYTEESRRRRGQRWQQTSSLVGGQQRMETGNSTNENESRRSNSSSEQINGGASTLVNLRQRCPRLLSLHVLHYGFYQSFRLLSSGTTLAQDWGRYFRNGTCDPDISIITGHSLGGAFTIYASILGWPGAPITFAAPRAVINGSCPTTAGRGARTTTTTMVERSTDEDVPITRIYLTDDPVPATLPVNDAVRLGIGGSWVHCGCALALQPSVTAGEEEGEGGKGKQEFFAAKAMGCGSNEPLREATLLPSLPSLPVSVALPSLGQNRGWGDEEEVEAADANPLLPGGLLAPEELKRHVHTRYVRAMDEACQGPLDSMRCLFDHEV
ncbi:hypothetical protein VYU27_005301 [Nannochloropsis oceanica]